MINRIRRITRTWHLAFKNFLPLLLLLAYPFSALIAQRATIVVSREIEVPPGVTVHSNGPASVRITGRSTVNSRHLRNKYVVSSGEASPDIFVINKKMPVNSWRHNIVKQVVTVVVETENNEQLAALRQALQPTLSVAPTKEIYLEYELNIARFSLYNGLFQDENNSITLTDGRVYPLKYLEVTNEIFVPETAELQFDLYRTHISMGDHQGAIKIALRGGSLSAGCLSDLDATITDGNIKIDAIEKATFNSTNSQLDLGVVSALELSSSLSTTQVDSTGSLKVVSSLSDQLRIHKVGVGTIQKSVFSNVTINFLDSALVYSGKSVHLKVTRAGRSLRSFQAFSQDGSISFPLLDLPAAHLECSNVKGNRFFFPTNIPGPEEGIINYDYEWGDPESTASVKLGGSRCEFHFNTKERPK